MLSLTLAQIREAAAYRADVVVNSGRNTEGDINALINSSLRRFRLLELKASGSPAGQRASDLSTTASTAEVNGWPGNEFVALPTDLLELRSIAVQTSGSDQWRPLSPLSPSEADLGSDILFSGTSDVGIPEQFLVDKDNNGLLIARLWPRADGAYPVRVVYTPEVTTLGVDTDAYSFHAGTEEWVLSDVALAILTHNGVPETSQFQALQSSKLEAERVIIESVGRLQRVGPRRKVDTRQLRRAASLRQLRV